MRRPRFLFVCCGALAIWCVDFAVALAAPTVWSGLTFEFNKPSFVFPYPVDQITSNVALTRGSARGLYNAELDLGWNGSGPTGTKWATLFNNPTGTIAASNWQALTFGSWINAYGGGGVGTRIEDENAVVYLQADDIYLDLKFTDWVNGQDEGGGGGFTYLRAVAPLPPTTTGDYNGNGVVDAADYVEWRDTLTQSVTAGSGADGNANGTIDAADYDFWRARFGTVLAGSGSSMAVPEPTAAAMALIALALLLAFDQRRLA
jgi:hypothetical protein